MWGKDEDEHEEDNVHEGLGADDEIDENDSPEVAAVMELAYLWAKNGRVERERKGYISTWNNHIKPPIF